MHLPPLNTTVVTITKYCNWLGAVQRSFLPADNRLQRPAATVWHMTFVQLKTFSCFNMTSLHKYLLCKIFALLFPITQHYNYWTFYVITYTANMLALLWIFWLCPRNKKVIFHFILVHKFSISKCNRFLWMVIRDRKVGFMSSKWNILFGFWKVWICSPIKGSFVCQIRNKKKHSSRPSRKLCHSKLA